MYVIIVQGLENNSAESKENWFVKSVKMFCRIKTATHIATSLIAYQLYFIINYFSLYRSLQIVDSKSSIFTLSCFVVSLCLRVTVLSFKVS